MQLTRHGRHGAAAARAAAPDAVAPGAKPKNPELFRVDRTTITLVGAGLLLVVVLAVLVTALVARSTSQGPPAPPKTGGVILDGPALARFIAQNYHDAGVTCPTVRTAVHGTLMCSDPSGAAFTVTVLDSRGAYTVRPG